LDESCHSLFLAHYVGRDKSAASSRDDCCIEQVQVIRIFQPNALVGIKDWQYFSKNPCRQSVGKDKRSYLIERDSISNSANPRSQTVFKQRVCRSTCEDISILE
jgi:hypothetical protein